MTTKLSLRQFGRFFVIGGFVGVLTVLVREAVAWLLPEDSPFFYVLSIGLAYAFGILCSFFLHLVVTFELTLSSADRHRFLRFFLVALTGMGSAMAFSAALRYLLFLDDWLGDIAPTIAFVIGSIMAAVVSYALNAHFVFPPGRPPRCG
jgi:putative flippase GtrA